MRNEWLSLLSFYLFDNTLFDSIKLPPKVDRETLINNLLLECSELEVVYSDLDFLKQALGFWSKSRLSNWTIMADLLAKDYDPFISMERYEERNINNTHSDNNKRDLNASGSSSDTGQNETYTNAWNSNSDTKRETLKNSNSNSNTNKETENINASGKNDTKETFTSKGDSALYTKQEILKQEMEIRNEFNIYDYIVNDFKKKFCLLVY